jgi:hypothetical protein
MLDSPIKVVRINGNNGVRHRLARFEDNTDNSSLALS